MFCRNFPVTDFKAGIKDKKPLGAEIFGITHFIEVLSDFDAADWSLDCF